MDDQSNFRVVNQSLGDSPSLGPLPGNQLIPWALLAVFGWFFAEICGFGLLEKAFLILWLIISWSFLTGSKPWKYLSKFQPTPYWACGYKQYEPLLAREVL